jgi:hypothetical protein
MTWITDLKITLFAGMLFLSCGSPLLAGQKSQEEPTAEPEQVQKMDGPTSRENPVSPVPYESGRVGDSTCEDRWTNFLPFLGQAACELGYVLPRPVGISAGYMHQDQPFDVGGIFINGIDLKTPGVAVVNEVQNEESTYTFRADVWILPFWNIYGILARTSGTAVGPLMVDLEPVFPVLCRVPGNDCSVDTKFVLDYKANVKGYGTTIAGGYKDFFGMIDFNWTTADLDISLTDAKAKVISSRIGWNGKIGGFTGVLWVGVMYQDISQTLDLPLDIGEDTLLVSIEQSTQEAYNYVIGGNWDINRSFSILAEIGMGKRSSQMLSFTYRF